MEPNFISCNLLYILSGTIFCILHAIGLFKKDIAIHALCSSNIVIGYLFTKWFGSSSRIVNLYAYWCVSVFFLFFSFFLGN